MSNLPVQKSYAQPAYKSQPTELVPVTQETLSDPTAVIALIPRMVETGDIQVIKAFGTDTTQRLSVALRETSTRLMDIDKQSSEAQIGKVAEELSHLVENLNIDNVQAPLESIITKIPKMKDVVKGMSSIPLIGQLIRKASIATPSEKMDKVVKTIALMETKREPLIESLFNSKDMLAVAGYTALEMDQYISKGLADLNKRIEGASSIVEDLEARVKACENPVEKAKLQRMLHSASHMHRGLASIEAVAQKTQMQIHTSLTINEKLSASLDEAVIVLPAIMDSGAAGLMSTAATYRSSEELETMRKTSEHLLVASDKGIQKSLERAQSFEKEGVISLPALKTSVNQLIKINKQIKDSEKMRITNTKLATQEIQNLSKLIRDNLDLQHLPQHEDEKPALKDSKNRADEGIDI